MRLATLAGKLDADRKAGVKEEPDCIPELFSISGESASATQPLPSPGRATTVTIQCVGNAERLSRTLARVTTQSDCILSPGQVVDLIWSEIRGGDRVRVGIQMDTVDPRMIIRLCEDDRK